MSDSVAEPSVGVSTRSALYPKLSLVAVVACLLAACDGPAPTYQWYLDNPTQMQTTLRDCQRSNYRPSYERCSNAQFAYQIWVAQERIREEERELAIARDTPDALKTTSWYENNRHARLAKLRECKQRLRQVDSAFDLACLTVASAAMNQYTKNGAQAFLDGVRLSDILNIHRAAIPVRPSTSAATPNPQRD